MSSSASDSSHPDLPHEQTRLGHTVARIDSEIKRVERTEAHGINDASSASVSRELGKHRQWLEANREEPYFARIDITDGDRNLQVYIGRAALDLDEYTVHSWEAPIATLRHETEPTVSYQTPDGIKTVALHLNRTFIIEKADLKQFHDAIDRRPGGSGIVSRDGAQASLLARLGRHSQEQLRDIVSTLQKEQEQIIRAEPGQILVINGVAGSGKTQVALHRLAYLLSPDNLHGVTLRAERTIVFVPSALFLNYVREVLPSLNVDSINHTTFAAWAVRKIFGSGRSPTLIDPIRSRRTSPKGDGGVEDLERAAHLKGSLRFARLLERLVDYHRRTFKMDDEELVVEAPQGRKLTLSRSEVLSRHLRAIQSERAFAVQRLSQRNSLVNALLRNAQDTFGRRYQDVEPSLSGRIEERLDNFLDAAWPVLDVEDAYHNWLSNRPLLHYVAGDLMEPEELEVILKNTTLRRGSLDIYDLGGLLYLRILIQGISNAEHLDHVTVDEGQDLSPLQYLALSHFSPSKSMTIIGDTAQSIHGRRGLQYWDELDEVFGSTPTVVPVTQNYRSTKEIVDFTNEVLKAGWGPNRQLAIPYPRAGSPVKFLRTSAWQEALEATASHVEELQAAGMNSIAVIVRTLSASREVQHALSGRDISSAVIQTGTDAVLKGVLVLTAEDAKGLEFDATIVLGVDEQAYSSSSPQDASLLYVATTRALHHLTIISSGLETQLLSNAVARLRPSELPSDSSANQNLPPRLKGHPSPFGSFDRGGGASGGDSRFDSQDGSKGLGHLFRDNGRFGSYPLHDRYDEESDAD
jgi:DNA helicase II / ATP-dependent DNA helicase PcrA